MHLSGKSSAEFIIKVIVILITVVLLRQWYIDIINFPSLYPGITLYESWGVNDLLINYQAGFVRRGLEGELLFQLYQIHPYPVVNLIIAFSVISLVTLFFACVWLFRKMGWPLWLLLFPMFFYYRFYGLGDGVLDSRRDAVMMLLAILLYFLLKKSFTASWVGRYLWIWLLSVIVMLLHEGMFFVIFPILIVITWYHMQAYPVRSRIVRTIFLWWPLLIVLLFVTLLHGTDQTAHQIWKSWNPLFERYPLPDVPLTMGPAIEALTITLSEALKMHFDISWTSGFVGTIPVWPFNIYLLLAIYYLMTQMGMFGSGKLKFDSVQMSNFIILQTIFSIPMLGFIADDWYRSIPYYCILSCFLYYFFPKHDLFPRWLTALSLKIQGCIRTSKLLNSPWTYCLVLIFLPFMHHNACIGGLFPFIPLELKHELPEMILSLARIPF